MSIITGLVVKIFIQILLDYDLKFDDAIMVYACIAYPGFTFLAFLTLFEGNETAKYFMSWNDFEVSFDENNGDKSFYKYFYPITGSIL